MVLTPVSFSIFQQSGETEGAIAFGPVREVVDGVNLRYYIHDGADWEHPLLGTYRDRGDLAIYYKPTEGVVEIRTYPQDVFVTILDVAPARGPIKLFDWLTDPFNAGRAVDFRRLLRTRWVQLDDRLFNEIPDNVIIAEGEVIFTMGALNGLGGDAEMIVENGLMFFCRPPPVPLLVDYVGKRVQVIKYAGRLTVIDLDAPTA